MTTILSQKSDDSSCSVYRCMDEKFFPHGDNIFVHERTASKFDIRDLLKCLPDQADSLLVLEGNVEEQVRLLQAAVAEGFDFKKISQYPEISNMQEFNYLQN